ncbi:UNKNOWN [Stylonychia lemnae]|uniref:FCP1 homology domain-containing protein n=1 Tax=Stylonychia lemnae TaxID=5949 RepID=A0A078AVY4_STYLE|nr:UNKNOWN [Stylonychia lemnae]|eukprot:CDW86620.1 UNKNOWN [Stylonychia lemnae]
MTPIQADKKFKIHLEQQQVIQKEQRIPQSPYLPSISQVTNYQNQLQSNYQSNDSQLREKIHDNFKKYVAQNIKIKKSDSNLGQIIKNQMQQQQLLQQHNIHWQQQNQQQFQGQNNTNAVRDFYYNNFDSFRVQQQAQSVLQNPMSHTLPLNDQSNFNSNKQVKSNKTSNRYQDVNRDFNNQHTQSNTSLEEYKEEIQELYQQKLNLQGNMRYKNELSHKKSKKELIRKKKRPSVAAVDNKKISIEQVLNMAPLVQNGISSTITNIIAESKTFVANSLQQDSMNVSTDEIYKKKQYQSIEQNQHQKNNAQLKDKLVALQHQKSLIRSQIYQEIQDIPMRNIPRPDEYQMPIIISKSISYNVQRQQQQISPQRKIYNQTNLKAQSSLQQPVVPVQQQQQNMSNFNDQQSSDQRHSKTLPYVRQATNNSIAKNSTLKHYENSIPPLHGQVKDQQLISIKQKFKPDQLTEVKPSQIAYSIESSPHKRQIKQSNTSMHSYNNDNPSNAQMMKRLNQKNFQIQSRIPRQSIQNRNNVTFKNYKNFTKRIFFNKRVNYSASPLLILVFDNLMGEFRKGPDCQTELHIRQGLIQGINELSLDFQVVIFTSSKDEQKIKFLTQCLRKRKAQIDGVYRAISNNTIFENFDQIFLDFQIADITKQTCIISPYYSEYGDQVIHSYDGYGGLHLMFKNICIREDFSQFGQIPLQILVPHLKNENTSFLMITRFIGSVLGLNDNVMNSYEKIKYSKKRKQKELYICETQKIGFEYMISHEVLLYQKQDQGKIESYITQKDNSTKQTSQVNLTQMIQKQIQESKDLNSVNKYLKDIRQNNEYIKQQRTNHMVNYYKRMSKANRNMRRDIIRQITDVKAIQIKNLELNENEDYDQIVAKVQNKVNHKFIVMRNSRKKQAFELEKLEQMISRINNLNLIDWLSKAHK